MRCRLFLLILIALTILCTPALCQKSQVDGTTQIFSTDFGKIQIDIPYTLAPDPYSSGTVLDLIMPNAEFSFPIVMIRIDDPKKATFEDFAAIWAPYNDEENLKYETMTTNDGHKMLFYAVPKEVKDGRTIYIYKGFIDYIKDKNVVVFIFANSENYYRKVVSSFSKEEFENVCKSFAFIN